MTTRLRQILEELNDDSRYVRRPGCRIFDEHTERYYADASGRPCRKDAEGARLVTRVFDRDRLTEIARRCNRRDGSGSLSTLNLGHTLDSFDEDGKLVPVSETDQPEPVGYAANYHVEFDPEERKHYLLADFYVARDRYAEAKTFPRVSVELWPRHGVIDPIALLRRTPQRDLGQWTYSQNGGAVLRYSMEAPMADAPDDDLFADATPQPAEDTPTDGDMTDDEVEQYMRHKWGHPDAKRYANHCMKRYGMPEEPATLPDPTDLPSADEPPVGAPPLKKSMAAASSTNGALPGGDADRFSRREDAIKFAKLEGENRALQARLADLEKQNSEAVAEKIVTQLLAEDYIFEDSEAEVRRFARMGPKERREHEAWVRANCRKAPTNSYGGSIVKPGPVKKTADGVDENIADNDHFDRALNYCRENGGDFEAALKATRNGTATKGVKS